MPSTFSKSQSSIDVMDRLNSNSRSVLNGGLQRAYGAELHRGTFIQVLVSADGVAKFGPSYELIEAKVVLYAEKREYSMELPAFVACGRRFRESSGKEVNLVEHFDTLLPTSSGIGLFTCQNGIQCSEVDLSFMCKQITKKLSSQGKKPLFIGIHNPSSGKGIGMGDDLMRLLNRPALNHRSIITLRQMFVTFSKLLSQLRPRLQWVHIAHSEAGLLANRTLTDPNWGLSRTEKALVKEHLITHVYGGVGLVPNSAVHKAINTYSSKDIALLFAQPYLDKVPKPKLDDDSFTFATDLGQRSNFSIQLEQKGGLYIESYPYVFTRNDHTVTVVECVTKGLLPGVGDHFFSEKTYQKALEDNLDELSGRILN